MVATNEVEPFWIERLIGAATEALAKLWTVGMDPWTASTTSGTAVLLPTIRIELTPSAFACGLVLWSKSGIHVAFWMVIVSIAAEIKVVDESPKDAAAWDQSWLSFKVRQDKQRQDTCEDATGLCGNPAVFKTEIVAPPTTDTTCAACTRQ